MGQQAGPLAAREADAAELVAAGVDCFRVSGGISDSLVTMNTGSMRAEPKAMCDETFGYYVFRNRWQDADDIQVVIDFNLRGWLSPRVLRTGAEHGLATAAAKGGPHVGPLAGLKQYNHDQGDTYDNMNDD